MGLLDKMFGKGGVKGVVKNTVNQVQLGTKKERIRKEYDEAIAKNPNVDRSYLLHSLETKYAQEPEFIPRREREPQHQMRPKYQPEQKQQKPKGKSSWDKFVDMGSNVNKNIERESFSMGGDRNFSGGFGEIDLMKASGFGASHQKKQHQKKQQKKQKKQNQQKYKGKSITINLG